MPLSLEHLLPRSSPISWQLHDTELHIVQISGLNTKLNCSPNIPLPPVLLVLEAGQNLLCESNLHGKQMASLMFFFSARSEFSSKNMKKL